MDTTKVTISNGTETDTMRFTQALWYAWGREDASGVKVGDVFEFASQYATRYKEFDHGQHSYMVSIQGAWQNWADGKPIAQIG